MIMRLPSGCQSACATCSASVRGDPPARFTVASVPPQLRKKFSSQPRKIANSSEDEIDATSAAGMPIDRDSALPTLATDICAGSPSHRPLKTMV